jgi:hypothetical protein
MNKIKIEKKDMITKCKKKKMGRPDVGLMRVILTTQEVEMEKISVQGQPGQKVSKTPSQSVIHAWWCVPVVSAMQEV